MAPKASIMVSMNRMDTSRRAAVIRCLIEGNSINSTVRMTGAAKNTVLKLLVVGAKSTADENITIPPSKDEVSRVMAALGRKGGKVGGAARANTLTKERRSEIAKAAAKKRWS
jgi:hypothetical protein